MTEKISIYASSDKALMKNIGAFIRHHRLEQNKTQAQLASDAGINRSTLVEFEKGKHANINTLIRVLRSLNLMHVLEQFHVEPQVSPLQLAEMQLNMRKRASKNKKSKKQKSDW